MIDNVLEHFKNIEEYIKKLQKEVDELTIEVEATINRMNITYASCIKTRIDSYTRVIDSLKNINMHDKHTFFEELQEYIKAPENKKIFDRIVEDYINKNFTHIKDMNIGDKAVFIVSDKPIKISE